MLIQCDPAIRAIILKLDSASHEFIVDDLDEQTLVVKESRLAELKTKLDAVCILLPLWNGRSESGWIVGEELTKGPIGTERDPAGCGGGVRERVKNRRRRRDHLIRILARIETMLELGPSSEGHMPRLKAD